MTYLSIQNQLQILTDSLGNFLFILAHLCDTGFQRASDRSQGTSKLDFLSTAFFLKVDDVGFVPLFGLFDLLCTSLKIFE